METATVQQVLEDAFFRLRVSRREAARELQTAAKIGQAIRGQRIRDMRDLDEARREKQEWVQRTVEMLESIVTAPTWAEQFNDFVPTILPEYAEFGMFVEVFEEEMRHRMGRLAGFTKSLTEIPEPLPPAPPPEAEAPPAPAPAPAPGAGFAPAEAAPAAPARVPHPEMVDRQVSRPEPKMQQTQVQPTASRPVPQASSQTVAAAILTEPAAPPRVPSGMSRGALILRTTDDPAAEAVTRFLEHLGLTLRAIDRRQPGGPSLLDELNDSSGPARFVLMLTEPTASAAEPTPEDLFDLGCCVGRMGAERVFALHRGGDGGTDRFGIAHVPLDASEGWQLTLARHLKRAGVQVDLNRLV